jgi:CheY-like chemotaxis protein
VEDAPVVVVVDDEEDSREALKDLLELEGYRVEVAANGREALDRVDTLGDRICLMLLDLYMPVMDGWAVAAGRRDHVGSAEGATRRPSHREAARSAEGAADSRSALLNRGRTGKSAARSFSGGGNPRLARTLL